ncbi:hypothetical protein H2248_002502 [Termitomyces sp. 'cryptogamus']|nr:hypothetical protein H2248_002502 [Termitomyces sp. 'cryptogamus']
MFRARLAGYFVRSRFLNGIPRAYCTHKSKASAPSLGSKTATLASPHSNSPPQPAHLVNQEGRKLRTGGSDFAEEVQDSKLVDKTWLIHEFHHQSRQKVSIFLRSRRFGKSMNLTIFK